MFFFYVLSYNIFEDDFYFKEYAKNIQWKTVGFIHFKYSNKLNPAYIFDDILNAHFIFF